jgi:hypothetical protein
MLDATDESKLMAEMSIQASIKHKNIIAMIDVTTTHTETVKAHT